MDAFRFLFTLIFCRRGRERKAPRFLVDRSFARNNQLKQVGYAELLLKSLLGAGGGGGAGREKLDEMDNATEQCATCYN